MYIIQPEIFITENLNVLVVAMNRLSRFNEQLEPDYLHIKSTPKGLFYLTNPSFRITFKSHSLGKNSSKDDYNLPTNHYFKPTFPYWKQDEPIGVEPCICIKILF